MAAGRLFDLLPPLDVGDPRAFMVATVAIFAVYPPEVMQAAIDPVKGIPGRSERPSLKLIKAVCAEIYEPIERAIERKRAEDSCRLALPPPATPRTPEVQARISAMVAEAKAELAVAGLKATHAEMASAPKSKIPPSSDGKRPNELTRAELDKILANKNETQSAETGHN